MKILGPLRNDAAILTVALVSPIAWLVFSIPPSFFWDLSVYASANLGGDEITSLDGLRYVYPTFTASFFYLPIEMLRAIYSVLTAAALGLLAWIGMCRFGEAKQEARTLTAFFTAFSLMSWSLQGFVTGNIGFLLSIMLTISISLVLTSPARTTLSLHIFTALFATMFKPQYVLFLVTPVLLGWLGFKGDAWRKLHSYWLMIGAGAGSLYWVLVLTADSIFLSSIESQLASNPGLGWGLIFRLELTPLVLLVLLGIVSAMFVARWWRKSSTTALSASPAAVVAVNLILATVLFPRLQVYDYVPLVFSVFLVFLLPGSMTSKFKITLVVGSTLLYLLSQHTSLGSSSTFFSVDFLGFLTLAFASLAALILISLAPARDLKHSMTTSDE